VSGYRLTESTLTDLDEILSYLLDEAGTNVALRLRTELFAKFERLAQHPGLGHTRSDLTSLPLCFFAVDPYLIIYNRDTSPIIIHAVLHGARDVRRTLGSRS
jgi:plasmid stabilization system protein ParE